MNIQKSLDALNHLGCQYSFYFQQDDAPPVWAANHHSFQSASIIKVPILLAWLHLERSGQLSRAEICSLDDEAQVQGAGYSWMLLQRQIPYHDVLLMMIALSDNLCTNLVINRIGLETLQNVISGPLALPGTFCQRKLMDYEARARGFNNWITDQDCITLFDRIRALPADDRRLVDSFLLVNQDDLFLKRNIPRDTLEFHHKTGSMTGVLHDWGYTERTRIFLLAQNIREEPPVFQVFGELGELLRQE